MSGERVEVARGGGVLEVELRGDGPLVVLIPSLGRGAVDFDELAERLVDGGFRAVLPEPRGIGASTAPLDPLTLADLADDVAAVIAAVGGAGARATVVGHAFGNRVARMTATDHPVRVDGVALLACGGLVAPAPEPAAALLAAFDDTLSVEDHLAAVATAFFAPGNDPTPWADGWHPAVAWAQGRTGDTVSTEHWWGAGRADVLVLQPADDVIAPSANADLLMAELGDRATLVTIEHAGHALLPEQPDAVADALLTWLRR